MIEDKPTETRLAESPVVVSDLTRLLVLADEAAEQKRPLSVRDLSALCYLLGTDPEADVLSCSYRYRFSPGPTSAEFEADLAQLETSRYTERRSPLKVSPRGKAWLEESNRAADVRRLREIARRVLPQYLGDDDLVARTFRRSQEITRRALERDLAMLRDQERRSAR